MWTNDGQGWVREALGKAERVKDGGSLLLAGTEQKLVRM